MTGGGDAGVPTLTARIVAGQNSAETDVSVGIARQYSTAAPPLLAITFENVWTRSRRFHFEYTAPFTPLVGRGPDGAERLHLLPRGGRVPDGDGGWSGESVWSHLVPDAPEAGCWRVTGSYSRTRYEAGTVWTAAPGESATRSYAVLDSRDAHGCFPSGTYRYEGEWREKVPGGSTVDRTVAFEIDVER